MSGAGTLSYKVLFESGKDLFDHKDYRDVPKVPDQREQLRHGFRRITGGGLCSRHKGDIRGTIRCFLSGRAFLSFSCSRGRPYTSWSALFIDLLFRWLFNKPLVGLLSS